jgi:hypothetical protein
MQPIRSAILEQISHYLPVKWNILLWQAVVVVAIKIHLVEVVQVDIGHP